MKKFEKEDKNFNTLVDRTAIYDSIKNNKISNEEAQKFVDSIFENYFLDNDNINFLQSNDIDFFRFKNEELCYCLSTLAFKDCCKKSMKSSVSSKYVPFVKSLLSKNDYETYLNYSSNLFTQHFNDLAKKEKCNFKDCSNKATENKLYNLNFDKNPMVTTNKVNPFDNNYKMGENFFSEVTDNNFKFFGLCRQHDNEIKKIELDKNSKNVDIYKVHFKIVLYRLFISRVQLEVAKEEFVENFNNIKEDGYKALEIYKLKKLSNHVKSLINLYTGFIENIFNNKPTFKVLTFNLPQTEIFEISDILQPQVCPKDYLLVNSVNNIYIKNRAATINLKNQDNYSYVTIVYDSKDDRLSSFFEQYMEEIKGKLKNETAFISNCSLILCDNILFNKDWWDKLKNEDKQLYSALNKFRYENPSIGQEYIKMKFFAGFSKGNNFF